MTLESLIVSHLILFIMSLQLLLSDKIKNWPEFAVIAAGIYSFSGFFVAGFMQHNHYGDMADFIIILLGGMFILCCIVITPLLIFRGLSKNSLTTQLCVLILVIWLGNFLNDYYQKMQLRADTPQAEQLLGPENHDLEAKNRALELGVDPNTLKDEK